MTNIIGMAGYKALIDALVKRRKEVGMSQRDLAKKLGCSKALVGKIETRDRPLAVYELTAIAEALNADPVHLYMVSVENTLDGELTLVFSHSKPRSPKGSSSSDVGEISSE